MKNSIQKSSTGMCWIMFHGLLVYALGAPQRDEFNTRLGDPGHLESSTVCLS